jgi:hypothetical protein
MRLAFLSGVALILLIAGCTSSSPQHASTASPAWNSTGPQGQKPGVLLVCNGSTAPCPSPGPYYVTIQDAVEAARPGDWILIYPGVYHEKTKRWPTAGVWITTPDLHIRGMDRNTVIIDGSNGTAAHPCPSAAAEQDFTPRDGIVVWKASGVTIQNLTVCDYLAGAGNHGNEIWWNGGATTGRIGMGSYSGSYLTATSEWASAKPDSGQLAQYGIFADNASGPGLITNSYASNMGDAAYYIGGCAQVCNVTLAHDTGVNSSEGYSGTNAGGRLVIKDSTFRLNRAGVAPNSANSADQPSPQDGRCPGSATVSCTIIEGNLIEANNNPNAPGNPSAPPIGTGVQLAGVEYDTVANNVIEDQGSWGVLASDYADNEKPPANAHCLGGIENDPLHGFCLFKARGNLVYGNVFSHVGFFGNVTNSDLASLTLASNTPRNCFYRNFDLHGPLTSAPADIQSASVAGQPCGLPGPGNDPALTNQIICATGAFPCPLPHSRASYPKRVGTVMLPLPPLPSMPTPCAGVPENAFCPVTGASQVVAGY